MPSPGSRTRKARPSTLSKLVEGVRSTLEDAKADVDKNRPSRRRTQPSSNSDAQEAARATVRSACVAAEQRFSRSGGNPLHAWEAIWMCTSSEVTPMPLPRWCIVYLHETAQGLIEAEGDGKKLAAFISRQLRFTRIGWTAVKARASAARATRAALLYDEHRSNGMSSAKAFDMVRETENLADISSARKLVKSGKEMLSHIPTGWLGSLPHELGSPHLGAKPVPLV
jgi:hypothetical protein